MLNKKVTVLMPVYNGQDYVGPAIQSILDQSYTNFDFLIINDGSTDNSEKIIKKFNDNRIHYIVNEENIGLIETLNKGLRQIHGKYIVRMDADDISLPLRIEKQVEFMDANPEIVVSGTSVKKFNNKGFLKQEYVRYSPDDLKTQLLFGSPLRHPTVIMRNEVLKKENYEYDIELNTVEDYGLWQKISEKYPLGNIKEPFLEYRINENGITQQADKKVVYRDKQHIVIYQRIFESLGIDLTNNQLQVYRDFVTKRIILNEKNLECLKNILLIIKDATKRQTYSIKLEEQYFKRFLTDICIQQQVSYSEWNLLYKKYLKKIFKWTIKDKLKFILKKARSI